MQKCYSNILSCGAKELYAQAYGRISSYLQPLSAKGYNSLIAIQMVLAGNIA